MKIGIIFIMISAVVPLLLASLGKSTPHHSNLIFTYPRPILYVGMLGVLATSLSITMIFVKNQFEYRFLPLLLPVALIHIGSWYLILLQANWQIELSEAGFIVRNIFRRKKICSYSEICKIVMYYTPKRDVAQKIKLFMGRKRIIIECTMGNSPEFEKKFLKMVKKVKRNDEQFTIEKVNSKI